MGLKNGNTRGSLRNISSVSAVPDNAKHRWKLDAETGINNFVDFIGVADSTDSVGITMSQDKSYQNGYYGLSDGVDDYVQTTALGDFGRNIGSGFALGFTINAQDTAGAPMGTFAGVGMNFAVEFGGFDAPSSGLALALNDANSAPLGLSMDNGINTGTDYRFLWNAPNGSDVSTWDAYIDNGIISTTVSENTVYPDWENFSSSNPFTLFARTKNGSVGKYFNGILDDVIIYSSALSDPQITQDYEMQPWT